ncbi:hypothetical protein HFO88_26885 [Rhizobium leguminosarum]|nr:hypothetical protein [Rhizobium leguminosarum]MBY5910959.1 hypothetical protein [Rhizobium leguminosarum]
MMAGQVTSSNFTGSFSGLNGTATLTATRPDIIRSLLTVGYPSRRSAVRVVGPWREKMLFAMATGYLDLSLNSTAYFRNLERSEKAAISFLFGEAFTHWYAQARMNIQFLVHVAGLTSCSWGTPTTPLTPKTGATPPAPKSRPDFIGIHGLDRHVFESKGRIRSPSTNVVSKALGQVSALHSINGHAPITRCASFFMLKASGTVGKVVDPPGEGKGIAVNFDVQEALAKAYSFFLDQPTFDLSDRIGKGYVGREIEEGVLFGIDKEILSAVSEPSANDQERRQRVSEIFAMLADRSESYSGRRDNEASPGSDGTLLVDRRSPPRRILRRR